MSEGFGRTPPETIGDSKTEFNRILCTSKSEAAVTSNKTRSSAIADKPRDAPDKLLDAVL